MLGTKQTGFTMARTSLVDLASNPSTSAMDLIGIWLSAKKLKDDPKVEAPALQKRVEIQRALAKNPNSPLDLLNEAIKIEDLESFVINNPTFQKHLETGKVYSQYSYIFMQYCPLSKIASVLSNPEVEFTYSDVRCLLLNPLFFNSIRKELLDEVTTLVLLRVDEEIRRSQLFFQEVAGLIVNTDLIKKQRDCAQIRPLMDGLRASVLARIKGAQDLLTQLTVPDTKPAVPTESTETAQ